jgi:hypothetical protein
MIYLALAGYAIALTIALYNLYNITQEDKEV